MSRDLKELIREAAQLPESDRATLAGAMIESLDPTPTPEVEAAWSREIACVPGRRRDAARPAAATAAFTAVYSHRRWSFAGSPRSTST